MIEALKEISHNYKDKTFINERIDQVKSKKTEDLEGYFLHYGSPSSQLLSDFTSTVILLSKNITYENLTRVIEKEPNPLGNIFLPLLHYVYLNIEDNAKSLSLNDSITLTLSHSIIEILLDKYSTLLEEEYLEWIKDSKKKNSSSDRIRFVLKAFKDLEWYESFFKRHPVFTNTLYKISRNYSDHINLFLKRLKQDISVIKEEFQKKNLTITSIIPNLGDLHRNAQTTTKIVFSNGKELFYKPRSSKNEKVFYEVVEKLNYLGLKKSLKIVESIDMGTHSWHKGVKYKECENIEEIENFYFHQGVNCFLADIFCVQDLITENIIAVGEYPCYIDLEICFHPKYKNGIHYKDSSKISELFRNGILMTGLLPEFGFETIDSPGVSNAGLSLYTNEKKPSNIPKLNQQHFVIDNYSYWFIEGFKYARSFFVRNIDQIKSIVKLNDDIKCRVLIRYTNIYSRLIKKTEEPSILTKNEYYLYVLEHLYRAYHPIHVPAKIIQSEIDQIINGDFPYFYTKPNGKDLYDANDRLIVKDYFKLSGYKHILEKLNSSINDRHFEEQLNIIKRSFNIHNNLDLSLSNSNFQEDINKDLIYNISQHLLSLSYEDNLYSYIDYTITKDSMWSQDLQDPDIFQGIGGIGLFLLAYYVKESKNEKILNTVQSIFKETIQYFEDRYNEIIDNPTTDIGVTHFPISILTMSYLYNEILPTKAFSIKKSVLEKIFTYIKFKLRYDSKKDFLFGSPGLGLLLLKMRQKSNDSKIIIEIEGILDSIGNNLVNTAKIVDNNKTTWETQSFDKWGGFAHGTAAIAFFLFKLYETTENFTFKDIAIKALNYDQSLYDKNLGFYKKSQEFIGFKDSGWANGYAGIALSRYLISPYYTNDLFDLELRRAKTEIEDSMKNVLEHDLSLSSGFFGMLEIYDLIYSDKVKASKWMGIFENIYPNLGSLKTGGWDKKQKMNGLYYGLAGIGYSLIRIKYKNLPSVLYF